MNARRPPLRIVVHGAGGRMGRSLSHLIATDPAWSLRGAVSPSAGRYAEGDATLVPDLSSVSTEVDALIDFSRPEGLRTALSWCREHRIPVVSGTTDLSEDDQAALVAAGDEIPVFWSANMSTGIQVMHQLLALAVRALAAVDRVDMEISETHHRDKADAPSGTALALAETLSETLAESLQRQTDFTGEIRTAPRPGGRQAHDIDISSLRGGDVIGDHRAHFLWNGERLDIGHRATGRDVFARGALRAARWLVDQPAAYYQMSDLLDRSSGHAG